MKHSSDKPESPARRAFMGRAAGTAAVGLAPGLTLFGFAAARAPDEPVSGARRWGMLVDTDQCARGCDACVRACDQENAIHGHGRPETDARWIRKVTLRERQTGRVVSLPLMCQHCEHPPCVDVCPTGASFKRADGIVLVDKHICIGCRYCMMACPYKARSFIHEPVTDQDPDVPRGKGTVESCTLCVHKVDAGEGTTACAQACAAEGHQAILFGDLSDPESPVAKALAEHQSSELRSDLGLNTGVRYRGL